MKGRPNCHQHPGSEAALLCDRCDLPICDLCTAEVGYQTVCRVCKKVLLRRRALRRGLLGVLLLGLLGAGGYVGYVSFRDYVPDFDHGKQAPEIRRLGRVLAQEPCDRNAIIKLGEAYNRSGDYRAAILRAERFFKDCGPYPRLRWVTYTAHKALSEWSAAASEATVLIKEDPDDKDYRWWRGVALEKGGDAEGAIRDYRQAIALVPRLSGIPFNLASVLEKQHRFCEAAAPLENFLHFHPQVSNAVMIRGRISRLRREGKCDEGASANKAVLRFNPRAPGILVTVTLGEETAKMLVDTGASLVSLTPELAARLGLKLKGAPSMRIHTAGGVRIGEHVLLPELRLKGLVARQVEAVVMKDSLPEGLGGEAEGLLGLSFLNRFSLHTDSKAGVMRLER